MKKFITAALAVSLITASLSVPVFADTEEIITEENIAEESIDERTKITKEEYSSYKDGIVKEITDEGNVVIETEDGDITVLDVTILSDSTQIGKKVRCYENCNLLISLEDDRNSIVDVFSPSDTLGEYVNSDETLAINISENTPITDITGSELSEADIEGHYIAVIYNFTTMSIPPITNPIRIIILDEVEITEDEADNSEIIGESDGETEIYIEEDVEYTDEYTVSSEYTLEEDGVTLVPVRKIAEALGYEVVWNGDDMSVTIGTIPMGVSFKIGENFYSKAKTAAIELSAAPMLINDTTYVPVDFFEKILETKIVF